MNIQQRIKKLQESNLSNLFTDSENESFNSLFNKKTRKEVQEWMNKKEIKH